MDSQKPIRTCIACRTKKFQDELLRIVRTQQKTIEIDRRRKKPGRGAYLCYTENCFSNAIKRKAVFRHLEIVEPEDFFDQLMRVLNAKN